MYLLPDYMRSAYITKFVFESYSMINVIVMTLMTLKLLTHHESRIQCNNSMYISFTRYAEFLTSPYLVYRDML